MYFPRWPRGAPGSLGFPFAVPGALVADGAASSFTDRGTHFVEAQDTMLYFPPAENTTCILASPLPTKAIRLCGVPIVTPPPAALGLVARRFFGYFLTGEKVSYSPDQSFYRFSCGRFGAVPAGGGTFLSADKKVPKEAANHGEALFRPVAVPGGRLADGAASLPTDRCHSLGSLHPPPAALPSLPPYKFANILRKILANSPPGAPLRFCGIPLMHQQGALPRCGCIPSFYREPTVCAPTGTSYDKFTILKF